MNTKFTETVQDCSKHYVHRAGEICRKCGRKGVAKKKDILSSEIGEQQSKKKLDKETLADVIKRLSDGVDMLRDSTGCTKTDIESVLDGLETLARDYTR